MIKVLATIIALPLLLSGCGGAAPKAKETGLKELTPSERPNLRASLIETMVDAKAYDSAVPLLRQALREQPKSAKIHYLLATVLRERGRLEQAVAEFKVSLTLNQRLSAAHSGLGMTYNLLGRHGEGTASHQAAIKLNPDDGGMLNNLGFSLYLEKKYAEAEAAYERAIRADPSLRIAYVNLGFALAAQDKTEPAQRAFSQVLSSAEVANNLAIARELKGDDAGAITLYQRALVLDPGLEDAITNLGALSTTRKKEQQP